MTDWTLTRPPVPSCLVTMKLPSGEASTMGKPMFAMSGMICQSYWQLPPLRLSTALDDVAGDRSGGDAVPIVELPAELVHQRSERQARVGQPAADNDVRTFAQRLDERGGAEIDVGGLDLVADRGERFAGFHVVDLDALGDPVVELVENVVAGDDADLYLALQAELACDIRDRVGTALDVYAAGVREDLDILSRRSPAGSRASARRNRVRNRPSGLRARCFCRIDIVTSAR